MAKKIKKMMSKKNKVFLFFVPVALVTALGILYFSGRASRRVAGLDCGCGDPGQATGEFEAQVQGAIFNNQPVATRMAELTPTLEALKAAEGAVLGATSDERWIEIDLSEQKLYAHNGDKVDYEMLVSAGKWAPTPTGDFRVWIKLRYTLMHGGSKEKHTYYYLPNVPYTQYFHKGYGLHGAYWHNNFGHPMSHGCVNLSIPDAEKLFYWTSPVVPEGKSQATPTKDNPGTRVVVHT